MSAPLGAVLVRRLAADVPEFRPDYPLTLVLEELADALADRGPAEAGDLGPRAFAWVERLAASGDPALEELVTVSFLEAFADGGLGRRLAGPATLRLAAEADADMIDPSWR